MKTLNYSLLLLLTFLSFSSISFSQDIKPVLIDKAALSGVGLKKIKLPNDPDRAFFQKRVYKGEEISVYVISSETATTNFQPLPFDEFIYLLNGRAHLSPEKGEEFYFNSGDFIIAPKGYRGEWEVIGGNRYHLELSVITNSRSDTIIQSNPKIPFRLDPMHRSGTEIMEASNQGDAPIQKQLLFSGSELKIQMLAESARQRLIKNLESELFIHVLTGLVTIYTPDGSNEIFYPGDFFILPKGFTGTWESQGQHLFRSLQIEKAW